MNYTVITNSAFSMVHAVAKATRTSQHCGQHAYFSREISNTIIRAPMLLHASRVWCAPIYVDDQNYKMVQLELRKMLAVSADDLHEQDLEQWYEEVTATESDQLDFDELDRGQCENMFNVFRRILLYKGEQVRRTWTFPSCSAVEQIIHGSCEGEQELAPWKNWIHNYINQWRRHDLWKEEGIIKKILLKWEQAGKPPFILFNLLNVFNFKFFLIYLYLI